jgi:hypothetical protein
MLLIRDVLQIEPSRMKSVKEIGLKNLGLLRKQKFPVTRIMTDFIGAYYTLVIESEVPDLGSYEKDMQATMASPEWQAFYGQIRDAVRGGRREVFHILG